VAHVTVPTVAAINGHCFAAAFAIALTCDYRVMRSDSARNAFLSTNEVHFGAPWSVSMAVLFRAKVDDSRALRAIALQGDRLTPGKAKELGLVDEVYGETTQETLGKAVEYAKRVAPAARMGAWGLIKVGSFGSSFHALD
jgi:enoyl-CoA hydratase/carnithine racemase